MPLTKPTNQSMFHCGALGVSTTGLLLHLNTISGPPGSFGLLGDFPLDSFDMNFGWLFSARAGNV